MNTVSCFPQVARTTKVSRRGTDTHECTPASCSGHTTTVSGWNPCPNLGRSQHPRRRECLLRAHWAYLTVCVYLYMMYMMYFVINGCGLVECGWSGGAARLGLNLTIGGLSGFATGCATSTSDRLFFLNSTLPCINFGTHLKRHI